MKSNPLTKALDVLGLDDLSRDFAAETARSVFIATESETSWVIVSFGSKDDAKAFASGAQHYRRIGSGVQPRYLGTDDKGLAWVQVAKGATVDRIRGLITKGTK